MMAKSVYSLVLHDEIVAAIDRIAAREGYSRSALVNHVLAQYASVLSPQQNTRQVLNAVLDGVQPSGLRAHTQSQGCVTLRTTLGYKYNPALSYTLQVLQGQEASGQLRVSLRSQNQPLLEYFHHFFALWENLEQKHLESPPEHQMEQKRYLRNLRTVPNHQQDKLGQTMAAYIAMMDDCMKTFFQHLDDAEKAVAKTEARYITALQSDDYLNKL